MLVIKDILSYMFITKLYVCNLDTESGTEIIRTIRRRRLKNKISAKFCYIVKLIIK
ncbi:MAG: hypothetical protein PHR25_00475 [Clostridia bacterium]|nr:hypothetical protein [Clostridia bacterium]MDD4375248.1 hypothetical protein [Clostridia bacterium]